MRGHDERAFVESARADRVPARGKEQRRPIGCRDASYQGHELLTVKSLLRRHRVSPAAFAFAIVMFAFPFVTVSCGGAPIVDLSGFQLAFGTQYMDEPVGPYALVSVALACAVIGAGAAWFGLRKISLVVGAVGAASLLMFMFQFYLEATQNPEGDGSIGVISRISFWLAVSAHTGGAAAAWSWLPRQQRASTAPEPAIGAQDALSGVPPE